MRKKVLRMLSMILCAVYVLSLPVVVKAEEPVYYDTEQGRFVNDLDSYLVQLNSGTIEPFDSKVTNYESDVTPFDLSDPSEKCSNILGHKWGGWGDWSEVSRIHYPKPPCIANMERWRFCTRKNCNAHQIETDAVWVQICNH